MFNSNGFGGSSNSPFGAPANPFATQSSSQFGSAQNSSTPSFGTPTFGASPFGASSPSGFGASSLSGAFGSTTPAFGASPGFNSSPAFGSSIFGQQRPTAPLTGFSSSQPSFGTTTFGQPTQPGQAPFGTSSFGTSSAASFGTPPFSGFGSPTTTFQSPSLFGGASAPSFGAPSAPAFGATSTPAFGATSAFGASTSIFGAGSMSNFGTPATGFGASSSPPSVFGSTTGFGSSSAFGASSSSPFASSSGFPSNTGTRHTPYIATPEQAGSTSKYVSICAMNQYENKSVEELKWEDYQRNDKGGPLPVSGFSATGFGSSPSTSFPSSSPSTFGSSSPAFGNASTSNPFNSSSQSLFGSPSTPSMGFGVSTSAFSRPGFGTPFSPQTTSFNSGASTPAFGSTFSASTFTTSFGAPGFGGVSSATPSASTGFGTMVSPSTGAFGFSSPAFSTSFSSAPTFTSTFGNTGTPSSSFGTSISSGINFSSTPAFGSTPAAQSTAFNFQTPSFSSFPSFTSSSLGATTSSSIFSATGSAFGMNRPIGLAQSTSTPSYSGFGFMSATASSFAPFSVSQSSMPSSNFGAFGTFGAATQSTFPTFSTMSTLGQTQPQMFQTQAQIQPQSQVQALTQPLMFQTQAQMQPQNQVQAQTQPPMFTSPYGSLPPLPNFSGILSGLGSDSGQDQSTYNFPKNFGRQRLDQMLSFGALAPRHFIPKRPTVSRRLDTNNIARALMQQDESLNSLGKDSLFIRRDYISYRPENGRFVLQKPDESNAKDDKPTDEDKAPEPSAMDKGKSPQTSSQTSDFSESNLREAVHIHNILPKLDPDSDYYTIPSIEEMKVKEKQFPGFCSKIKDFIIGHKIHGSVKFFGFSDVRGLDLLSIVRFNHMEVYVYDDIDKSKKPALGEELNKPSDITFLNIEPPKSKNGSYTQTPDAYTKKLMRMCEKQKCDFKSYNFEKKEWVFTVPHFTRYGRVDTEQEGTEQEEEEGEEEEEEEQIDMEDEFLKTPISKIGMASGSGFPLFMDDDPGLQLLSPITPAIDSSFNDTISYEDKEDKKDTIFPNFPINFSQPLSPQSPHIVPYKPKTSTQVYDEEFFAVENDVGEDGTQNISSFPASSSFFPPQGVSFPISSDPSPPLTKESLPRTPANPRLFVSPTKGSGKPKSTPDFRSLVRNSTPSSVPLSSISIRSRAAVNTRIPFSLPLHPAHVAEDSKCIVDASFFMGSSFRVGWGPRGIFCHSGYSPLSSNSSQSPLVMDSSLLLDKVEYVLSPFPSKERSNSLDISTMLVSDSDAKEVKELSESYFVNLSALFIQIHEKYSHDLEKRENRDEEKFIPKKLVLDGYDVKELCNSFASILNDQLVKEEIVDRAKLVLLQQHFAWNLFSILFEKTKQPVAKETVEEEEEDMEVDRFSVNEFFGEDELKECMQKRASISSWLQKAIQFLEELNLEKINHAERGSREKRMILRLSNRTLEDAIGECMEDGNFRLACMVAEGGALEDSRHFLHSQLDTWQKESMQNEVANDVHIALDILSGRKLNPKPHTIDWRRFLSLLSSYSHPLDSSVSELFIELNARVREKESPFPLPLYLEKQSQEGSSVQEDRIRKSNGKGGNTVDVAFSLMQYYSLLCKYSKSNEDVDMQSLYIEKEVIVKSLFSAHSFTYDTLDFSFSWFLFTVMKALNLVSVNFEQDITMNFSSQLLSAGRVDLASYVILHLPHSPSRVKSILQEILCTHCPLWIESSSQTDFLQKYLCLPPSMLHRARALYYQYKGMINNSLSHYIKGLMWNDAHKILMHHIGSNLFLSGDFLKLFQIVKVLNAHNSDIENWRFGGKIYYCYLVWKKTFDAKFVLNSSAQPSGSVCDTDSFTKAFKHKEGDFLSAALDMINDIKIAKHSSFWKLPEKETFFTLVCSQIVEEIGCLLRYLHITWYPISEVKLHSWIASAPLTHEARLSEFQDSINCFYGKEFKATLAAGQLTF